jgi:hypothetical protein
VKSHIFIFIIVLIASATAVHADPLTFSNVTALQNSGNTSINLFTNPGTTLTGSKLTFTIDVTGILSGGGTDTLLVTYNDSQGGSVVKQMGIPLFGSFPPPVTVFVTIDVPTLSVVAIPATLTVDLLNSNPDFVNPTTRALGNAFTYSFNVAQPVPEPASLTLFFGGIATLLVRHRRVAKNKKSRAR